MDLQKYDCQGIIKVIALMYSNICGSFRLSTPLEGSASLQPAMEYHVVEWGKIQHLWNENLWLNGLKIVAAPY